MLSQKERKNYDDLFRLMRENPDLPVLPMVDGEIPVSERLPERRRRVLCRLSYPDIEEIIVENQYYGNGMWMEESEAVTHWMPLPEPPEEG